MRVVNRKETVSEIKVLPLQIFISVQNGRQYVMAYEQKYKRISSFRIDNIVKITPGNTSDRLEELRGRLEKMKSHMWGVSTQSRSGMRMEMVTFTVRYGYGEQHIHQRLEREKRCGHVKKIDDHTSRFYAEVYDASELIPWIRTFLCRITEIHFSNAVLEAQFRRDIENMYRLYEV